MLLVNLYAPAKTRNFQTYLLPWGFILYVIFKVKFLLRRSFISFIGDKAVDTYYYAKRKDRSQYAAKTVIL